MNELLTRAVEKVIPQDLAEKKFSSGKKLRLYFGIDPTGSQIHLGHAVPLRKMQAFADAGHEVIFLIGSFTAMIGDPSGRDEQRSSLTRKDVEKNFKTYKKQASKVLDFSKIKTVYNHKWHEKLRFEDILKLTSYFTKQQMEQREMFQRREKEGNPIYMYEFMYPLMQGYDSVMLDVDFEIGGSDQEFNMLAGRTLQKAYGKREKCILTMKLIEGTDGRKMSKTYNNCVYLEDEPNDMFGKLMTVNDDLMEKYFECCTDVPMDKVASILSGNPRDAKARLAKEIVTLYHGSKAAQKASDAFDAVFKNKELPDDMPIAKVKSGEVLIDVLVREKLIASKSEARRLVDQKGVKVNDVPVESIDVQVSDGVVKVGKRKFLKIIVS